MVGKGSAYFIELDHPPGFCAPGRPLMVKNVKVYELSAKPKSNFDLSHWTGTGGRVFTLNVSNGIVQTSKP